MLSENARRILLEKHRTRIERRQVSNQNLCDELGLSDDAFAEAHRELEKLGFLRVIDPIDRDLPYSLYDEVTDGGLQKAEEVAGKSATDDA